MISPRLAAVLVWVPFSILADKSVSFVDPFIGTQGNGHTTPAACRPFGMIQAGPDTGFGKWCYCSGYQHADDEILGFSQTHLSGTGCPDLGDVSIMPFVGEYSGRRNGRFDKSTEKAGPGWYEVCLCDSQIKVEITATKRVAVYRITYPKSARARLLVNLPFALHYPDNSHWGKCRWMSASSRLFGDQMLIGRYVRKVWSTRTVAFAVRFDHPISVVKEIKGSDPFVPSQYFFDFNLEDDEPLIVSVALSARNEDAARQNLEAEASGVSFEQIRHHALREWDCLLSRIMAEGEERSLRSFYTALYHLFVQPNDISDVRDGCPFYSTFSTWDTFRAAHPFYALVVSDYVPGMIDSLLRQGRKTGYLPIWPLWGDENQCMIGTHSVPILVDAYLKRLGGSVCWNVAYRQIKETLTARHAERQKENWALLDTYGYYPFDIIKGESVSRTMECAYDDWCAGMMAEKLGHKEDAAFFFDRAASWKNVFDSSIGLVRGKDSHGAWRTPFNPIALGHGAERDNDFTEGNAYQYVWHVMQDPEGLVRAMGGKEVFAERLGRLFSMPDDVSGRDGVNDVTGLIGQYVHGNEPSHHVIYFYPQIGKPECAAERVREVFDKFYLPKPDGLCGNDDCGQMSAWYLFSAMGFYPFNPCGGEYVIGAPQLPKIVLNLPNGKTFTVLAKNLSSKNKYVKSVALNGKSISNWKIRHADIVNGGVLLFEMCGGSAPGDPVAEATR